MTLGLTDRRWWCTAAGLCLVAAAGCSEEPEDDSSPTASGADTSTGATGATSGSATGGEAGSSGSGGTTGGASGGGGGGASGQAATGGVGGESATGGTQASGAGGSGGTSGDSGAGGSGGTSGNSGAGGSGGTSGNSGTGGSGGTSGNGGAGGASGASGSSGAGAAAGSSGSGGTAGVDRSGCKRGVAYGYHSEADMTALSPGVSWWYNWATRPDSGVSGVYETLGVEYVPMVWGGSFDVATVASEIPSGAVWVLGFNEPNFFSQANLSAAQAAALWPQVEQIATQRDLGLVSPAVNYCGGGCHDTDPFNYLDDFFAACTGCQVDTIAIHIYVGCNAGGTNHAEWLINHVENYKARFEQPIWLTEFACDDAATMEEQRQFMVDAVTYLENEPRIVRYAWFAGRANNMNNVDLLGADGQLTELGDTYVHLPHNAACGL